MNPTIDLPSRRLTTPRPVYLIPLLPTPAFCWLWTWECIADHGDRRTVKGPGLPSTGQEVQLTNASWTMHDDYDEAVAELRRRLASAMVAQPRADWSRVSPIEARPDTEAGA